MQLAGPGSTIGEADANCFLEIIKGATTVIEPCDKGLIFCLSVFYLVQFIDLGLILFLLPFLAI